jgi:hypothetical protein
VLVVFRLSLSLVALAALGTAAACRQGGPPARPQGQPEAPCALLRYAAPEAGLETLLGDLDGDGRDELVTARLLHAGADPGQYTWLLSVARGPDGPALRWLVDGYGEGSFAAGPQGACHVLATEWVRDPRARSERGSVLIGRRFELSEGRLLPLRAWPVLARWNSPDFEAQRCGGAGLCADLAAAPLLWLGGPRVERPRLDPWLRRESAFGMSGTVSAVVDVGQLEVVLQTRARFLARLRYGEGASESPDNAFERFGDGPSRRLYPPGYLPAEPEAWLRGRPVVLSTHPQSGGLERRVLWVH